MINKSVNIFKIFWTEMNRTGARTNKNTNLLEAESATDPLLCISKHVGLVTVYF